MFNSALQFSSPESEVILTGCKKPLLHSNIANKRESVSVMRNIIKDSNYKHETFT